MTKEYNVLNRVGVIYKITSPSGRVYVGKTKNFRSRLSRYKNLECKKQRLLYHSLNKYGFKNHVFEVILETDLMFIDFWEQYYIRQYNSFYPVNQYGMNLTLGGEGTYGHKHTKESRSLMREAKTSKHQLAGTIYVYGFSGNRVASFESLSDAIVFAKTTSTADILSALSENVPCAHGYQWSYKTTSSAFDINKYQRNKLRARSKNIYSFNGEVQIEFPSMRDAAEYYGCDLKNIEACAARRRENCAGVIWQYHPFG